VKRYWIFTGLMLAFFLATFGVMEAFHVDFLEDPTVWMHDRGGWTAAAVGVGLLIADVFLPVPSSLVMIAHGALFGIPMGTALSLLGSVGAAILGFGVGRRGGPMLTRMVTESEKTRADALLKKWGALAVLITRPIPLMAETVSILAGASPMGWGKMIVASIAGSAPAALLYALTGATAKGFANSILMFGVVILIAGLFWFIGKKAA
jgi:uncharacterized membrane protein YdjX (TVP38/TMEM64 family)